MEAILNATQAVSIVLLSLVVPVFVFSVSLLGQAIESARKDREAAEKVKKAELGTKIESLKEELDQAMQSTDTSCIKSLSSEIARLERERKRALRRIERTSGALTARGAVAIPGAFFLVAVALTALSRILVHQVMPLLGVSWAWVTWLLALGSLVFGIAMLWKTLTVVQLIAIRSEETVLRRTIAAFKQSQRELDLEKQPELTFRWRVENPVSMGRGEERVLGYSLNLTKGQSASQAEVWFFTSPEIEMPGRSCWAQGESLGRISEMTTSKDKFDETLIPGINYGRTVKIKAPHTDGMYSLLVDCKCVGFRGELTDLDILVGEQEEEVDF